MEIFGDFEDPSWEHLHCRKDSWNLSLVPDDFLIRGN